MTEQDGSDARATDEKRSIATKILDKLGLHKG